MEFEARTPDADEALELIRELFRVEHDAGEPMFARPSARQTLRTTRSKPVDAFVAWSDRTRGQVLPEWVSANCPWSRPRTSPPSPPRRNDRRANRRACL